MLSQTARHTDLRVVPAAQPAALTEPKVAVVVNANARKVTDKVLHSLSHVIPMEDLFLSRSLGDARHIAQAVLDRRYHTVFCGGGDGTFVGFTNEVYRQLESRRAQRAPKFGVLKLGTGNSLASVVQASPLRGDGILDDVLRTRAGEVPGYRRLDLLMVDGQRTPFAGLGIDGKILNDYVGIKERFNHGMLKSVLTGGGGYFSSVVFKTIPGCVLKSMWFDSEVRNTGNVPAYRLDSEGRPTGEPIAPGELMFKGPLMMAAAATIPFYGFEFRMFPFAGRRRGMMHLRLGAVSTASVLMNLHKLWKGKWFPEGIHDFHAQRVEMKFHRPMPLQVGGDAAGYRDNVTFGMAPEQVELVDFTGAVN